MGTRERTELRGTVLDGRYHVGACIGVGGTGVVFEAKRLAGDTDETLVIKTMRPIFAQNADLIRRVRREAEVARRVPHRGIIPVVDEGLLDDGSPFLVMPRHHGESLSRLLLRVGVLPAAEAAAVGIRVANILHVVHGLGYVHRDVKPEHVLMDRDQRGNLHVHLLDFGVCAANTAPADERERERGRVYGTPTYVSPEQASGNPDVDGRADLFGLGVVIFESLAGRVPFTAPNIAALLRRIIREDAPLLGVVRPEMHGPVEELVARALARSPEARFQSSRSLARALGPLAGDRLAAERSLAGRLRIGDQHQDTIKTIEDRTAEAA